MFRHGETSHGRLKPQRTPFCAIANSILLKCSSILVAVENESYMAEMPLKYTINGAEMPFSALIVARRRQGAGKREFHKEVDVKFQFCLLYLIKGCSG